MIESEENVKRVFTDKKDFPLSTILEMYNDGDIIPQPSYQRGYVMDEKQASKLIESVLLGIPIPGIYLSEEQDGRNSVIDGQQRITSFVRFMENKFSLKGLEELCQLNGKFYKDLKKTDQRTIKQTPLNCIVLTKESEGLKYEIFARLNQGSTKLRPQELRNCIYRGSFNDMLEDIANNNKLLPVMFHFENKRKDYQENILRFFALRNLNDYSSSLKKTFNDYMEKHRNADEKEIEEDKRLFNSTIDIIKQVLGENAFGAYDREKNIITNKFSGSVYDSIICAFSMFDNHDIMVHADEIRNKITDVKCNDEEYRDYTYAATGSKNRVIGRIMHIYNIIADIVGKAGAGKTKRTFSNETKEQLWHDGYICPYCNQQILSIDDAEVDHVVAYSNGGETVIENAQLLHRHCNREKSNKEHELDTVEFENEEDDGIEGD